MASSASASAENTAGASAESNTNEDIYIAVMGITGAGKSSFIQQCVPSAENIVGDDYDSCTRNCMRHEMIFEGKRVILIDTPGFNDSFARDADILNDLAGWLAKAYESNIRLDGLVYLHGIQDARMSGSDRMHLNVFKQLSGLDNMPHVVLATSFWDCTSHTKGEYRETLLLAKEEFWKLLKDSGAKVLRFKNDSSSAMAIVKHIVDKNKKTVLKIQQEMETEGKSVRKTGAGQTLEEDISERVKLAEKEDKKWYASLEKALKEENAQAVKEAIAAQESLKAQMDELNKTKNKLDITSGELIAQKDAEIKRARDEAERLRLEQQKSGEEFKRQLSAKDEESNAKLEKNDQEWQQGIRGMLEGLAGGLAANSTGENASSSQGLNARQTEEKVEEMFKRYAADNKIKELEARLANTQLPPSYSSATEAPPQQQLQQQQQPQVVYYPQQSQGGDVGLGMAAGGMGALALMSGCSVM